MYGTLIIVVSTLTDRRFNSKMPMVRNARSFVTSRELPSGLQIWGKSQLNALFSVGTMNADTDSAPKESVKVIQGCPWYAIRTFDVSNNGQPP